MKPYPRSRVTGETVREVIADILIAEVKDPRLELVTVTGVDMSPDLRHANVFVVAHGGPERYEEALAGLESAKGHIRSELGHAVRMKHVPELHFALDESVDLAERIEGVIRDERSAGRVHDDEEDDDADAATAGDEDTSRD